VYALTPAGVAHAREILNGVDARVVEVDGRRTSLGDARRALGLAPLPAALAVDEEGRLRAGAAVAAPPSLIQRDADLAFLRRWAAGGAPVAVVYGSRGMGKTALGRAFAANVSRVTWLDLQEGSGLASAAASLSPLVGIPASSLGRPQAFAEGILAVFERSSKVLVVDGYGEMPDDVVEGFAALLRLARTRPAVHILVLAQEGTPAYCRFYGRKDVEAGAVVERRLKGLDLEGCRELLGVEDIDGEALRRIYLLTKGSPLYLRYIRERDAEGLKAHSRFTKAEIRLLLYSGRDPGGSTSAS